MAGCLKCSNMADYCFRVLEVRTLHVRDITGEKRVQALGEFCDYAVCKSCAAAHLAQVQRPADGTVRRCAGFGTVLALGLVLTAVFWRSGGALRMMGISAIICGMLGLVSLTQAARKHRQTYAVLDAERAEALAAWEVLLAHAPKKSADTDLSYIPVNEKTLAAKNGDLMLLYDLLPDIAIQAHRLLHDGDAA